jgi:hypothetical protein
MNLQKILISGILVGVVAFFLGWLLWGILLADFTAVEGMKAVMRPEEEMVMWAMGLANILWGLLLAYIFIQWANITTVQSGFIAGAVLGFLMSAAFDFGMFAMTNMYTLTDVIKDVVLNTVFVGVLGAFLGWWLGRK